MQEEIEQKSFNIMISTTKLSARTVLRAVKAAFRLYQSKTSQGKQSVRTLLRQNRGVSSVEISKTGIRGLERYTLYCREWMQFLILLVAEFGCFLLITAGTVIVEAVEWFSGWIAEL